MVQAIQEAQEAKREERVDYIVSELAGLRSGL